MRKDQHVIPHQEDWAVVSEDNSRLTAIVETQEEAIRIAREIAMNHDAEIFIHAENGRIRESNIYRKVS